MCQYDHCFYICEIQLQVATVAHECVSDVMCRLVSTALVLVSHHRRLSTHQSPTRLINMLESGHRAEPM